VNEPARSTSQKQLNASGNETASFVANSHPKLNDDFQNK